MHRHASQYLVLLLRKQRLLYQAKLLRQRAHDPEEAFCAGHALQQRLVGDDAWVDLQQLAGHGRLDRPLRSIVAAYHGENTIGNRVFC